MTADVMLALDGVEKRFGGTVVADRITLDLNRGEFFTLLGPSGSGKSTILRMIAGLEQPDGGRILLEGTDIAGTAPWKRGLGMVFQQYANFPHMNVAGNVSYGLRRLAMSAGERDARVGELLALVGLAGFETRPVTQLSGGEQQRVAIARALAPRPKMLLLDEPLSALDEKIRREMQDELRRIQNATGTTFVYVTHDQEEALTMSDRIAVLYRGHCVQCDAPEAIFRRPRTRFVARFFRGCNVLEGRHEVVGGRSSVSIAGQTAVLSERFDVPDGAVGIAVRGEDIHLADDAKGRDLQLAARLEEQVYRGLYTDYRLALEDGQPLSAMIGRQLDLTPSGEVAVGIDAAAIVPLAED
ncbi:MAG: ABC transporter ATP-binding protein [Hyphomicrobiales bacterium]